MNYLQYWTAENLKLREQIASGYDQTLPNHSFQHGESRSRAMALLEWNNTPSIMSHGELAMLAHDMLRGWIKTREDERNTCEHIAGILTRYRFDEETIKKVCHIIEGTDFSERWNFDDISQKFAGDADLFVLWSSYEVFLHDITTYFLEISWQDELSEERILKFYNEEEERFFDHLLSISWRTDSPFITETARQVFPNFENNRRILRQQVAHQPKALIQTVRDLEITEHVQIFRESLKEAQWISTKD